MHHPDCTTKLRRPHISIPATKFTKRERAVIAHYAAGLAGYFIEAGKTERHHHCFSSRAAKRLEAMTEAGRRTALRSAHAMAGDKIGGVDASTRTALRRMLRKKLDQIRPEMTDAARNVAAQVVENNLDKIQTYVHIRPDAEIHVDPRRSHCTTTPPRLACDWHTTEPGATRIYWELRGPVGVNSPGQLLDYGFADNQRDDGTVGGTFVLNMLMYLGPGEPDPTQEFHLRVLPLAAPEDGPVASYYSGFSFGPIGDYEPDPPAGLGPWSPPAIILIGRDCRSPGTVFDFREVDYYRKARVKINWFRVDADQPGPGDEEYHLSAFVVKITPVATRALGTFGTYMTVAEGDQGKKPLNWKSYIHDLDGPFSPRWPQQFLVALSALEEDAGEEVEEWLETMAELASEALEGDLADEIMDFLKDVREDIEEAKEELHDSLKEEFVAYIGGIVGAAALNAVAAIVAAAVAIITAWARAGSVDDFFGIEVVTLILVTNDAARVHDGTALQVGASRVLADNDANTGVESNGRFETGEIDIQLIAKESPDAAGLDGIVRFGLSMEFYDKVSMLY